MTERNISVAVLPLHNTDEKTQYLSDGISDTLISKLASIGELKVTSRISSYQFRNKTLDVNEISNKLGVRILIEGTGRLIGPEIKVMINIIAVDKDEIVWSDSWTSELEKIFELENDIAEKVVNNVRNNFHHFDFEDDQLKSNPEINIEIYKEYLKANHIQSVWHPNDTLEALEIYNRVIEKYPTFYDAYINKMNCYSFLLARKAIKKEVAIKDISLMMNFLDNDNFKSADYHIAKAGNLFWGQFDFDGAFQQLMAGLELNPSHSEGHNFMGLLLSLNNQKNKSMHHFKIATDLDPLSAHIHGTKAWGEYCLGLYNEAIASYEKCLDLSPKQSIGMVPIYVNSSAILGKNLNVLYHEIHENNYLSSDRKESLLGYISAHTDDYETTKKHIKTILRQYEANQDEFPLSYLVRIYAKLGEPSKALKYFNILVEKAHPLIIGLLVDSSLGSLTETKEFNLARNKINFLNSLNYNKSNVSKNTPNSEWIENTKTNLLRLIDEEKPYLEPSLSLKILSDNLNITSNSLSWLINNEFQVNFNDFVNGYRVETFKQKVIDPKFKHMSLLGIAFESGFNSKSSFNTVFKKLTGKTPKEYSKTQVN